MKYITPERVLLVLVIGLVLFFPKPSVVREGRVDFSKQTLDSILNKNKEVILRQEMLITENQETIKVLTDSVFSLSTRGKTVITYFREGTTTVFDTLYVPYEVPVPDSTPNPFPLIAKDSTQHYNINMIASQKGINVTKLEIPDTLNLRVLEKNRLFKPNTFQIEYFHTNPYIKTNYSNSLQYKSRSNKWLLPTIAIAAGIVLGTQLK